MASNLSSSIVIVDEDLFNFKQNNWFVNCIPILQEIQSNKKLCDIYIKVRDKTIPCHRLILAMTAPYFHQMLCSENSNIPDSGKAVEVIMKELNAETIESVINYLYSGEIAISTDNVENLLICSNLFQLSDVSKACIEFMTLNLSASNVLKFRRIAESKYIRELISDCDKYISKNFAKVSAGQDFVELKIRGLIDVIQRDDLRVSTEIEVFEAAMKWVKYNEEEGILHLPDILKKIRLCFLPCEYLVNVVSSHHLIRQSMKCRDIVEETKSRQLMGMRSPSTPMACSIIQRQYTNDAIFLVFGSDGRNSCKNSVLKYTPDKWIKVANLPRDVKWFGGTLMNKKIYIIGGQLAEECSTSVGIFDTETLQWRKGKSLSQVRTAPGIATLKGCIYISGGTVNGQYDNSVICYSELLDEWIDIVPLNQRRSYCKSVSLNGFVYVMGGIYDTTLTSMERYCPKTNKWKVVEPMGLPRCAFAAAVLNGKIYVCGGMYMEVQYLFSCEMYDPETNTWTLIAPMHEKRSNFSLVANNGKLYAFGGYCNERVLSSVEEYSPHTNEWKYAMPMPEPASDIVAVAN